MNLRRLIRNVAYRTLEGVSMIIPSGTEINLDAWGRGYYMGYRIPLIQGDDYN